ncbi:hypothetical protein UFOVP62_37 [uncultured Caudovirales phage]|uniref:Uncharacterized protein n=1 Tax=uncultured Caudovirales phage TaxID=2100421 RepID=A0A6J5KUN0_9CAUD|nr:hypothetical protein UFOVP62_37 [uncultured Caudovirales phage]
MTDLNEKLAQEAAELINGGEWRDGKWYSDGQRDAWRKALKPAADRIEKLEMALREIMELGYWDVNVGKALKIARKALEGKDD